MSQLYCVLDYETRSRADLRKVGGYEYARHPSTRILCAAWAIGTLDQLLSGDYQVQSWSPALDPRAPEGLVRALADPSITLVAHNAFFEQVITRFVLAKFARRAELHVIPHERWICTASMARALALPGKLEMACAALGLRVQKDMEGHRLMMKMSKPRKPTKKDPREWHSKRSDLDRLVKYCETDIEAEIALFTSIPMLSPSERRLWLLDQKINLRGFEADRELVKRILKWTGEELARFERETFEITRGVVRSVNQRDATLRWLASEGLTLPDLTAKTVSAAILGGLASGKTLDLLKVRSEASKTSTAKYAAFEARSRTDGRCRDNLVYSAAGTKRWGGAGVQPQNFPRGTIDNTDQAAEILADPATDLELIRMIYGNPLEVFASCLRAMIRASEGKVLIGGDFAGIELRVLFWIAKHEAGLQAIREGRDLYVEMAAAIFNIDPEKLLADYKAGVPAAKRMRQVGKEVILGAGFQMGGERFLKACVDKAIEMDKETAEIGIKAYRSEHPLVPQLWSNLQKAAHAAVLNPGKKYTINRTSWWVEKKFLFCQLPSGGRIAYYGPSIRMKMMKWGEKRACLYHWGVDSKTKKWKEEGTYGGKLTENIVQATARDLMAGAMVRAEARGVEVILSVHDELLGEVKEGAISVAQFEELMAELPAWAEGLPVKVEGWSGKRYKK